MGDSVGGAEHMCVFSGPAAAKGWESWTELTYRGHYSHLFQANIIFLPLFWREEANSVCFIPRLTACRVIYSSFHMAGQEFTPFSSSADAATTLDFLLEPSICN